MIKIPQERFNEWKAQNDAAFWAMHRRRSLNVKVTSALRRLTPLASQSARSFTLATAAMALLGKQITCFNQALKDTGFEREAQFDAVGMCGPLAVRLCVLASRETVYPFGVISDALFDWWNARASIPAMERRINRSKALRFLVLNCFTDSVFWDHVARRLYRGFRK